MNPLLGQPVYIASTGNVHHVSRQCRGLRRANHVTKLYQREAELYFGRSACYVCQPIKSSKGK